MKPNFALSLSFEGLRLMHRAKGGWHLVGQVALDDADLTGALARLNDAALTLEPNGITTKILIPNDQIKYLAIDTTRTQENDVRAALDGATPYSVDQLCYDFSKGGGRTYVAAVARETLDEAEQFAVEHGFNPVSFAAVPEPFTYVGEAFFGATRSAGPDQTAERDQEPVIVTGQADVEVAPAPEPPPQPVEQTPVQADVQSEEPATPDPLSDPEPVLDEIAEQPAEPDAAPNSLADDTVLSDIPEDTPPVKTAPEAPTSEPQPETVEDTDAPVPVFASRLRADRSDGMPPKIPAPLQQSENETRAEPSISRPLASEAPPLAVPTDSDTGAVPPLSAPDRGTGAAPAATPPVAAHATADVPDADVAPPITGEAATTLPPEAAVAAAPLKVTPTPDETPATTLDAPEDEPSGVPPGGAVGEMFASRRMARAEKKQAASAAQADDKSRFTVFGARKKPKPKPVVGGKPRFLGLILTAVLILFLLALAAFAAMSEDGIAGWFDFGRDETQIAAEPAETPPDPTLEQSEVAAQPPAEEVATAPDTLATPTIPSGNQLLTPEDADRIYAATGVWQKAPRIPQIPRTTSLDALSMGAAPGAVPRAQASPLASTNSVTGDALIAAPIDPPAPDATFNFGDDGLIVATQDGTVTPDGTLIIAGRPPLEPPTRPGTVAPPVTPQDRLAAVLPEAAAPLNDAPEGVIVIAGRPAIEPPVRAGPVPPVSAPPSPTPQSVALAAGTTPLLANDGLLVLAGTPPILPPARPGTTTTSPVAQSPVAATQSALPNAAPQDGADVAPLVEGLNVILGTPPVLPPARPTTIAPQSDAALDTLTSDIASALTGGTAQSPSPNTQRPLVRPAAVAQAAEAATAAAQAAERAATAPVLGALTVAQAAAFRPLTRPAGLAPAPQAEPEVVAVAPAPVAPVGLQIAPAIAAAVAAANSRPNPIVNPTALAIPVSRVPDLRPRNMARIVERATAANARAAAAAQQTAAAQQVAAAQVAPRAVTPSGPTGNAVAQNATLDNAINLRDVNLIGIYGGDSDRRALIRMANGRYQRVNVGDRLDGGRVTAISAGALSYTKRGRAITLEVAG